MNYSYHLPRGTTVTTAEKISIALPPEMVHIVRSAVSTGEYASSSEVIRDALRDWTYKRSLRQQGVTEFRKVWEEAMNDKSSGISPNEVLDRLERKYQTIADSTLTK
jgi:antitoxin ParD1/3/4